MSAQIKTVIILLTSIVVAVFSFWGTHYYATGLLTTLVPQMVDYGHSESLSYYLEWRDYDFTVCNEKDCDLLHFANDPKTMKILIEHGCDPQRKAKNHFMTQADRIYKYPGMEKYLKDHHYKFTDKKSTARVYCQHGEMQFIRALNTRMESESLSFTGYPNFIKDVELKSRRANEMGIGVKMIHLDLEFSKKTKHLLN